jgi:hypothetical protein
VHSGGAFPTKWYWAQCNSFDDYPDLAFTAGGGIRQLPFSFLPGKKTETLGLIGIHYNGTFFEIVPWTGEVEWKVWPWGRWEFRGRCTDKSGKQFEAEVVAVTNDDVPGVLLRAPTKDQGMVRFEFLSDAMLLRNYFSSICKNNTAILLQRLWFWTCYSFSLASGVG